MHRVLQSYELHIVSEHLADRYPYLEKEFKEREDPSEVYHSVFDHEIPKLVSILSMKQIEKTKYRDALITLNEMVSHQENKDKQINANLVQIASDFLLDDMSEIQREAILLLGSLVSIMEGRNVMTHNTSAGLAGLLFHQLVLNREACGWCLVRIASGRDGVEFIANKGLSQKMIESFLKYSYSIEQENVIFLIYLLEAFTNILQYDNGIEHFLGTGMVQRLHYILQRINRTENDESRMNYLCLDCLAKISVNMKGKQECIDEKVIATANLYLDSEDFFEVNFATNLIMSCTIHLGGKKQCVHVDNDLIIKRLITSLNSKNEELRTNIKQTLINIADLPDGFLIITKELVRNINYLEEIFGPKAIVSLAAHLPQTREIQYPPLLPEDNLNYLKQIVIGICYFIKNYDDAIRICTEETVKLVEKLLPFMHFKAERELVANALTKICQEDEYSRELLKKYVEKYGNVTYPYSNSSLVVEIQKFPKLSEVIQGNQI